MAKVIDITEKLDFDSNPKIKIKDKEYEVDASAETVLKIMGLFDSNGDVKPSSITKMYKLVFNENDRNAIAKLNLKFNDFQTLVMAAVNLIIGEEGEQGE